MLTHSAPHDFPDMDIRGLSLDIWGTLLQSDPAFKPKCNAAFQRILGHAVTSGLTFGDELRRASRAHDTEAISFGSTFGLLDGICATGCYNPRQVHTSADALLAAQAEIGREHPPIPLHPELPALIGEIANVIPVAVTSNTGLSSGTLMRTLLPLSGFVAFTALSFSDEITTGAKPWPRIFEATARGLGVDAQHILHVGDNYVADVIGGRASGMQVAYVAPYDNDATFDLLSALLESLR